MELDDGNASRRLETAPSPSHQHYIAIALVSPMPYKIPTHLSSTSPRRVALLPWALFLSLDITGAGLDAAANDAKGAFA